MRFKQFLEAQVGNKAPTYSATDVDKAVQILNTHCKNALWMLHKNRPITRGDYDMWNAVKETGFSTVDASKSTRMSQNTSNHYTLIFDNHPEMAEFPKRSKSFICSTSNEDSKSFAYNSAAKVTGWYDVPKDVEGVIIIPYDNSKIGAVNKSDMWDTEVSIFDEVYSLAGVNRRWKTSGLPGLKWDEFVNLDKRLKKGIYRDMRLLGLGFDKYPDYFDRFSDKFLDTVFAAYHPSKLGLTAHTTADLDRTKAQEVWVGGKMLCISPSMWENLRAKV